MFQENIVVDLKNVKYYFQHLVKVSDKRLLNYEYSYL